MLDLRRELDAFNKRRPDAQRIFIRRIRERYPPPPPPELAEVPWRDLVGHPAFVLLPYQSSTIFMFQLYSLNVPIFAPSVSLLEDWHRRTGFLFERVYGHPPRFDDRIAPNANRGPLPPDPNSDEPVSLRWWLGLFEIYQRPHIRLFDSWSHLLELLSTTDLMALSAAMRTETRRLYADVRGGWQRVLSRMFSDRTPGTHMPIAGQTAAEALNSIYGDAHAQSSSDCIP